MIVIGGFFLGAVLGVFRAGRLGGKPADMAQYGAVFGLIFAFIGLVATIVIGRLALGS